MMLELSPTTNLLDPELVSANLGPPHQLFDVWRNADELHWNPPTESYKSPMIGATMDQGFWVLTRHEDVVEVSRDQELFSSFDGGPVLWDWEPNQLARQRANLMGMKPADHLAMKKMVSPPFGARELSDFYPDVQRVATEIIDSVAKRGACEFVFDVASKLPVYTFCRLLGVPDDLRDTVFRLGNAIADTENPTYTDENEEHNRLTALFEVAAQVAEQKLAKPDSSAMSRLVHGDVDGEKLDSVSIYMFFVTLSIAGHETTRSTAAHFIRLMSEYPEQYELIKSDVEKYLPNAIEEVLRYSPPVMKFRRTVTEDTTLRDHVLKAGDKIYLSYPAANRDPSVFSNPHKFDITRSNANKHLAFGIGPHFCMGARLARYQLEALLTQVIERIPDIQVTGDIEMLKSIWFNAVLRMPVSFSPET